MKGSARNPQLHVRLRQAIYLVILCSIPIVFVLHGEELWPATLAHWPVIVGVMVFTPFFLAVQAISFRYCVSSGVNVPALPLLLRIWALASITSFIAPLVAGLAVRVTLLKQEGLDIKTSSYATLLQTLINVEYAWITASIMLIFYPWISSPYLGYILLFAWMVSKLLHSNLPDSKFFAHRYLNVLKENFPKIPWKAQPWLWGQIAAMGFNYWLAFRLGGAPLSWHFSILLASITILASLAIFIPNGLGVLDGLWVWIASQQGLSLAEGIALALTIRLGFILGAICILLASFLLANRSSNPSISGH